MKHCPIYLLNCEGATDRLAGTTAEIKRVFDEEPIVSTGPNWHHEGWQKKCEHIDYRALDKNKGGVFCCATGHIRIYQHLLLYQEPCALVFEDDIKINLGRESFQRAFNAITATYGYGWDWCNLQNHPHSRAIPRDMIRMPVETAGLDWVSATYHLFRADLCSYGTGCYFITRRGARKLLAELIPLTGPIDARMRFLRSNGPVDGCKPDEDVCFNTTIPFVSHDAFPTLMHFQDPIEEDAWQARLAGADALASAVAPSTASS